MVLRYCRVNTIVYLASVVVSFLFPQARQVQTYASSYLTIHDTPHMLAQSCLSVSPKHSEFLSIDGFVTLHMNGETNLHKIHVVEYEISYFTSEEESAYERCEPLLESKEGGVWKAVIEKEEKNRTLECNWIGATLMEVNLSSYVSSAIPSLFCSQN